MALMKLSAEALIDAPSCRSVRASQKRTIESSLPEAKSFPLGWNATALTVREWPPIGSPTGLRVATSQTRIVSSMPADTSRLPSGLNATLSTVFV